MAVLAIVARFGLMSWWMRFRESDRWLGRPRFADWLIYLVVYTVGYLVVTGVMRLDPPTRILPRTVNETGSPDVCSL